MPFTSNKGLSVQTTGSNSGTWGAGNAGNDLNTGVMGILDLNLGGITTLSLSSSNVALTSTQSQTAIVRCTGALLSAVQITTSCIGFTFVENLTSGAFALTFTNGVSGVVIPQGQGCTVLTDGTNGARIVSSSGGFATGVAIAAFAQSTAPVGWTKSASLNDYALRLVNDSSGGNTGGSIAFTTAFAAGLTFAGTTDGHTLTTNEIPAHSHFAFNTDIDSTNPVPTPTTYPATGGRNASSTTNYLMAGTATLPTVGPTSLSGGGAAHSHTFTSNAFSLAVQYVNIINCSKN